MNEELAVAWTNKSEWGFSSDVPKDTSKVYYKGLLVCANGDGTLAKEERDWVIGLAAAVGLPDADLKELKEYQATDDITEIIADASVVSSEGRRSMIYDAIRASSADGDYHPEEQAVIHKMAAKLNVPIDVAKRLEELASQSTKLKQETFELLFPNGSPY